MGWISSVDNVIIIIIIFLVESNIIIVVIWHSLPTVHFALQQNPISIIKSYRHACNSRLSVHCTMSVSPWQSTRRAIGQRTTDLKLTMNLYIFLFFFFLFTVEIVSNRIVPVMFSSKISLTHVDRRNGFGCAIVGIFHDSSLLFENEKHRSTCLICCVTYDNGSYH